MGGTAGGMMLVRCKNVVCDSLQVEIDETCIFRRYTRRYKMECVKGSAQILEHGSLIGEQGSRCRNKKFSW